MWLNDIEMAVVIGVILGGVQMSLATSRVVGWLWIAVTIGLYVWDPLNLRPTGVTQ